MIDHPASQVWKMAVLVFLAILLLPHGKVKAASDPDRAQRLQEYEVASQPIIQKFYRYQAEKPLRKLVVPLQELAQLGRSLNLPEKECKAYNNVALCYQMVGQADSALYWIGQAEDLHPAVPAEAEAVITQTLKVKGDILIEQRQIREALRCYDGVRAREPDPLLLSEIMSLTGSAHRMLGDYAQAAQWGDSAIRTAPRSSSSGDLNNLASIIFMHSKVYWELGDYAQQIDLLDSSLRTFRQVPPSDRNWEKVADIHNDLGLTYGIVGDAEREREEFKKCLGVIRGMTGEESAGAATVLYNLGLACARQGKEEDTLWVHQAVNYLDSALAIWSRNPENHPYQIAKVYGNLSLLAGRRHQLQDQYRYADTALVMLRELFGDHHPQVALAWTRMAKSRTGKEKDLLVLQDLQEAIRADQVAGGERDLRGDPVKGSVIDLQRMLKILEEKANTLVSMDRDQGKLTWTDAAFHTTLCAIGIVEEIRESHAAPPRTTGEDGKPFDFMTSAAKVYERGMALAWKMFRRTGDQWYFGKALEISEKSKAVSLLRDLSGGQIRDLRGVPEEVLLELTELNREVLEKEGEQRRVDHRISIRRERGKDIHQLQQESTRLRQEVYRFREQFLHIREQVDRNYPQAHLLRIGEGIPRVGEIRDRYTISDRDAVLEYFYGSDQVYVLGISREKVVFRQVGKVEELEEKIDSVLAMIRVPGENPRFAPLASDLGRKLVLDPIQELGLKQKGRLVIVPDGKLDQLPFGALVRSDNCRMESGCDYLARDLVFSYAYRLRIRPRTNQPPPEDLPMYLAYLNLYQGPKNELGNLRAFRQSMKLGADLWQGPVYEIDYSSQIQVLDRPTSKALPRIVYFMSHGIRMPNPWDSYLALGSPRDSSEEERISVYDLMTTPLPVELLILPACFAGDHQEGGSYGPLSLASASQAAGVRSLVTSLWDTDVSRADGMLSDFLQAIADGRPRSEALALAQTHYLSRPVNEHPYYWANLVLIGDPYPIPSPSSPQLPLYTLIGTLLFAGLLKAISRLGTPFPKN